MFLPEGGLDVTVVAEVRPCGNWSSVGVEREYVPCDVDNTNEVVDSVVMNWIIFTLETCFGVFDECREG